MSGPELLLLVCAGLVGGLAGSIAGLASLASYPALLAVGLGPVTANVTNTVALVFISVGSILGSQPELRGQAPRVRGLAIAAMLGGAIGAALLLLTPSGTFERIAPWLIGASSLTILMRERVPPPEARHDAGPFLIGGVFAVAIYGGYFGAGAGVMVLAMMLAGTGDTLARSNALKNVALGIANAVAALAFVVLGHVDWASVPPLALGLFAGGRLGPIVVRRADAGVLRGLIGLAGLALAVKLGADAYA